MQHMSRRICQIVKYTISNSLYGTYNMTNSVENGSKISDVHYFGSSLEFDLNDQSSSYSVRNEIA